MDKGHQGSGIYKDYGRADGGGGRTQDWSGLVQQQQRAKSDAGSTTIYF